MRTYTITLFIAAICGLSNASPYYYAQQQPPKEIHINNCECIAKSLTITQCCTETSGVIEAASGKCNFSDESNWNQFTECCIKYNGSASCESRNIVEGQGRYNGQGGYHKKGYDEHRQENDHEGKGYQ
ncbi:hypothetical protein BDC45DRAFT_513445 [Circinella umbellata]|nr:hypothetical protein BDC45DRAFT_513445 [Circinella umbellata]